MIGASKNAPSYDNNHLLSLNLNVFYKTFLYDLYCLVGPLQDVISTCCHRNSNSTTGPRMAAVNMSACYSAVCADHEIEINPHVKEVLEKTTLTGTGVTIKLPGNSRRGNAQRLDDDDVLALSKCLRNNKSVTGEQEMEDALHQILLLVISHMTDIVDPSVVTEQDDSSSLRSLDLMFNDIRGAGAEVLARSLQCNSTLLSLRLSGNKIERRGAAHLASVLQVNSTLRELELADCDLDTQGVMALAVALGSNETLLSVDLSRPLLPSLQEEWAVHASEMLAANGGLLELHLGKMGMGDAGMERLSAGLRLNGSLRYLDLRCNRVTRDGVRHLSELLKQSRTLQVVDLSSNRIEDEGAAYLSEGVAWPGCVLRELSVRSNHVGTEGLLSLAQALMASTALSHLYIWGNRLEEPVCQVFGEMIASGRLPPSRTDVSAYEADGRTFLAEAFRGLRRRRFGADVDTFPCDASM
uniref:Leucine rich repeat containing 34 n=1 Tax=Gasterosteus aculeatus aculeatus TaxID=481459 RepID=G3PGM1_GASAC